MMNVPDILEDFFNSINTELTIASKVELGSKTTLLTNCTSWAMKCGQVIIGGNNYMIDSVVKNESITIIGTIAEVSDFKVKLKTPYFWHGTLERVSTDLSRESDSWDKYPLIYLYEPIREQILSKTELHYEKVNVTLMLLVPTDISNYSTDCDYEYIINPLREYLNIVINKSSKSQLITEFDNIQIISRIHIGSDFNKNGRQKVYESNLFNDNLTGIEINTDFFVKNNTKCYICN